MIIFESILDAKLSTQTSAMSPARRTDYLDKDDLKIAVTAILGFRPSKVLISWVDYDGFVLKLNTICIKGVALAILQI